MLHPARTLLGWMGLAHSPSRGLLLSRRGVRGGRQMPGGQRTVSVGRFRQAIRFACSNAWGHLQRFCRPRP
jgi:hypothetical protein